MQDVLSEVYAAVKAMGKAYQIRLPDDVWNTIVTHKNDDYQPFVDANKELQDQGFMKDTITLIAVLNRDYWCSEEERQDLIALFQQNEEEWQNKLSETTSTKDLLKMIKEK